MDCLTDQFLKLIPETVSRTQLRIKFRVAPLYDTFTTHFHFAPFFPEDFLEFLVSSACQGTLVKERLSRSACQEALVKKRLSRNACQETLVKKRLSRNACQGTLVKKRLSRNGCQEMLVKECLSRNACQAPALINHVNGLDRSARANRQIRIPRAPPTAQCGP